MTIYDKDNDTDNDNDIMLLLMRINKGKKGKHMNNLIMIIVMLKTTEPRKHNNGSSNWFEKLAWVLHSQWSPTVPISDNFPTCFT